MRIKPYLVPLIAGTIFLSSCKKNSTSLAFTNAKNEVPQLGNLVFRFNTALAKDSMLNAWDSTEYISFTPAIRGKFRWESPDQLVFSPAEPLSPSTEYKAHIRNAVLKFSKYNSVKNGDKIKFHTAPLVLEDSRITWVGENVTTAKPQLALSFNYPVDPSELKDKLSIKVNGDKADYSLITVSTANTIDIRLNNVKPEDREFETIVKIDKGLKPHKGNAATDEDISTSLSIPSPYILNVQKVDAQHDGVDGTVRITTSQQPSAESVKSMIHFDPAVTFTVEETEDGLLVRSSQFDTEKSYTISIDKGLRGKIGGVMKEQYTGSLAFGELEAGISFKNKKAVYLSSKGSKNIEVQLTNVPKVKIVISKIYESNLLMAQRYGYEPVEKSDQSESGPEYSNYEYGVDDGGDAMLGDVIYEKEIDTRSLPKSAGGRVLNFSQFEDRLTSFRGVYHVMIRSTEDYWIRDSRFISLSDLGLIAKQGQDKMYVFANSIKTASPVKGVNVTVYSKNNQAIGTGATDGDGVAEISYLKDEFKGFQPAMVIVSTADDFNYLPFSNTKVNTSRFDVGGKTVNASGLDAFIYAERDVYRPGEKINYAIIVRDNLWKAPGDIMLKMKLLLPDGKELQSFRKQVNEEGAVEGSVDIANTAITGSYTLEVYTANDVLLGSKNFSVEEFVPDRIKVTTTMEKPFMKPGESSMLHITAVNFFGPPAANRKYETEIQVKQKSFQPEKYPDYDFGLANQNTFFDKEVKEGTTDGSGNADVEYAVPAGYANMGVLQTSFYSTVFDETGRPVSRLHNLDIFTQDVFFGIRQDWSYYFPLNQQMKLQVIAVNKDGAQVNANARIEVVKHEYRTVLTKSGSYFRYESQTEDRIVSAGNVNIGKNTQYAFTPRSAGDYEVRIYNSGANNYVSRAFYSYGSYGADNNSFEVSNEGNIEIETDKKSYQAGEKVKALFKTPFSGKMLVTLETDHMVSHQYVDVSNRTAQLDLPVSSDHLPNVYITATLIKPHEVSDIPLTVAHGFKNVLVEDKKRKMEVSMTANKNSRSKTHQKITVKADPGSFVSLAAVDNGVLQVSDFKTPDPYKHFYEKKALQVSAYDLYPLLFAEVRARMSSTGGDGYFNTGRLNPVPAKRIKVVSYWGGMKKAGGNGQADFEFDIPQFSGELRLMAVAFKGNQFGSADQTMTVADPIVISTALPRFLSPGDTVMVPVTLTNTTSQATNATAVINIEGPMKVVGSTQQAVSIGSKSETRAIFKILADPSVNSGKITVTVNGLGEKFTDATEISVRPPSTLQKITTAGSINGGATQKIASPVNDFIPSTVKYTLTVSRSPVMELGEQLRYLVQYPYGCTEQTVSSAFPQLYYGDLSDLMQLNREQNKQNANTNIMEAIRKIKIRQLYNGAVTLWDGGGKEDWWTTIYAAHFLLEAKKAGFDVDNTLLETMLTYITNRLRNRETITYYYNRDQNKKIAPKEVSYGLYVLALAGRTNVPAMNYYKANTNMLALDSRYLLASAYAVAGDRKAFAALLPSSFAGEVSVPQTGGSYYSDVRDEAIALNALLEVDPGNAQVGTMVKHVADKLKSRAFLSTQERAFSFLALGKHARDANKSDATGEIKVNGKTIAKVDGGQWRGDQKALGGTNIEIATKGNGRLYYFWQAEGMSSSGAYREEDSYLKVRKKFFDRNGKQITANTFKQNDLIIIGITFEKSYSSPVENVVITDILPAGFEIENPRTKEIPGMDWIRDGETPTALDVRDDRIHFFVDAINNKQTYYYAVRAVSPGSFKMGPVNADAMYNGEYHSYNGAGVIRITQ